MDTIVFVFQILIWIVCPLIIGLVLLQGAAGDISSSFGGGGMLDSTLGVGAHRKMAKVTGILAGIFFIMVLVLAYTGKSSVRGVKVAPLPAGTTTAPMVPAPPATAAQVHTTATQAATTPASVVQPAMSTTTAAVAPLAPSSTPAAITETPPQVPAKAEDPVPPLLKKPEPMAPPVTTETHPETSQQSATAAPVAPPADPAPK